LYININFNYYFIVYFNKNNQLRISDGKRTTADYVGCPAPTLHKWVAIFTGMTLFISFTVTSVLCYIQRNSFPVKGRNLLNSIGQFAAQSAQTMVIALQYLVPCSAYFFMQTIAMPVAASFVVTRVRKGVFKVG